MGKMNFFAMTHPWLHKSILSIFKKLHIDKNEKILDIWCGNWSLLMDIHKLWYNNLFACDGYIENKELNKFAKFQKQELNTDLKYDENTFDVIFLVEVIEHLENPNIVLHEIHRILRKWGMVVISTPNIMNITSRLLFMFEGSFLYFRLEDVKTVENSFPSHIVPFLPYIFKELFYNKFHILSENYSNFVIPFIHTTLPIKNKLFGNAVILVCKKN